MSRIMTEIERFPYDLHPEDGRAGRIKSIKLWLNADNDEWEQVGELRYGHSDRHSDLDVQLVVGERRYFIGMCERYHKSKSDVLCIEDAGSA